MGAASGDVPDGTAAAPAHATVPLGSRVRDRVALVLMGYVLGLLLLDELSVDGAGRRNQALVYVEWATVPPISTVVLVLFVWGRVDWGLARVALRSHAAGVIAVVTAAQALLEIAAPGTPGVPSLGFVYACACANAAMLLADAFTRRPRRLVLTLIVCYLVGWCVKYLASLTFTARHPGGDVVVFAMAGSAVNRQSALRTIALQLILVLVRAVGQFVMQPDQPHRNRSRAVSPAPPPRGHLAAASDHPVATGSVLDAAWRTGLPHPTQLAGTGRFVFVQGAMVRREIVLRVRDLYLRSALRQATLSGEVPRSLLAGVSRGGGGEAASDPAAAPASHRPPLPRAVPPEMPSQVAWSARRADSTAAPPAGLASGGRAPGQATPASPAEGSMRYFAPLSRRSSAAALTHAHGPLSPVGSLATRGVPATPGIGGSATVHDSAPAAPAGSQPPLLPAQDSHRDVSAQCTATGVTTADARADAATNSRTFTSDLVGGPTSRSLRFGSASPFLAPPLPGPAEASVGSIAIGPALLHHPFLHRATISALVRECPALLSRVDWEAPSGRLEMPAAGATSARQRDPASWCSAAVPWLRRACPIMEPAGPGRSWRMMLLCICSAAVSYVASLGFPYYSTGDIVCAFHTGVSGSAALWFLLRGQTDVVALRRLFSSLHPLTIAFALVTNWAASLLGPFPLYTHMRTLNFTCMVLCFLLQDATTSAPPRHIRLFAMGGLMSVTVYLTLIYTFVRQDAVLLTAWGFEWHLNDAKRNVYITLMTASARAVAVAWRDRHCTFLLFSSYGMPRRAIARDPSFADDLRVLEIVPNEQVGLGLAG